LTSKLKTNERLTLTQKKIKPKILGISWKIIDSTKVPKYP